MSQPAHSTTKHNPAESGSPAKQNPATSTPAKQNPATLTPAKQNPATSTPATQNPATSTGSLFVTPTKRRGSLTAASDKGKEDETLVKDLEFKIVHTIDPTWDAEQWTAFHKRVEKEAEMDRATRNTLQKLLDDVKDELDERLKNTDRLWVLQEWLPAKMSKLQKTSERLMDSHLEKLKENRDS